MNDVIICTCIYNRTSTLESYIKSLFSSDYGDTKFHIYFIINYDEIFPKQKAVNETYAILQDYDSSKFTFFVTENIGLTGGFNIGINCAKYLGNIPIILANDDICWPKNWTKLLELPNKAMLEGKEVNINPESIGCIAGTYKDCGAMRHQLYDENKKGYTIFDYVVGHCQLITSSALKKGFEFDPKVCNLFGPADIYQSVRLLYDELNLLVCHDVCFDFHKNENSHFSEGDSGKFTEKLTPMWNDMQYKTMEFQKLHIAKHGFNKWNFI